MTLRLDDANVTSDVGQFAMIPKWLFEAGASAGAIHLWVALALRADRHDDSCYPSRQTLAKEMDCAERTVDARIKELEELGALKREARWTEEGDRTSNRYHLLAATGGAEMSTTCGADSATTRGAEMSVGTRTISNQNHLNQKERATAQFDAFWEVYPRHVAKKAAKAAFFKALKVADPETLIAGADAYRQRMEGEEPRFVLHGGTWLNGERWKDEPDLDSHWLMLHRLATSPEPLELTP